MVLDLRYSTAIGTPLLVYCCKYHLTGAIILVLNVSNKEKVPEAVIKSDIIGKNPIFVTQFDVILVE